MGQEVTRLGSSVTLGGVPVIGFGQAEVAVPLATASSPWTVALVTSVVSAAAGWTIEEVARSTRGKRRRR